MILELLFVRFYVVIVIILPGIEVIKQSEKHKKIGAKIPCGILFHGPLGTGKTLLASAVAGETKSTFFSTSGSEFVEKYVGVGAKRIRNLSELDELLKDCELKKIELEAV